MKKLLSSLLLGFISLFVLVPFSFGSSWSMSGDTLTTINNSSNYGLYGQYGKGCTKNDPPPEYMAIYVENSETVGITATPVPFVSSSNNYLSAVFPSGDYTYISIIYYKGGIADVNVCGEDSLADIAPNTLFSLSTAATPTPSAVNPTPTPTSLTPTSLTTTSLTTTTTTITVIVTATPTPTPKPLKDTVAPVVSIDTDFDKPFKEAPKITGKASDAGDINAGVAKVEYSTDDGKNWLPVETIDHPGAKSTNFSFIPATFEDGNYKLRVRAKDSTGNIGVSSTYTLIIDRLPPQVGSTLMSIGAQVLLPDQDGMVMMMAGLDQKITLSAIGGPITIDLISGTKTFSMVKNLENGLWSGILNFDQPGIYPLEVKAVDGANNRTNRILNSVIVVENGSITSSGSPIKSAEVSLFYFENTSKRFVLWDGKPYSQANPQKTDDKGNYRLFIPPGKYYLQIKANTYETLKSTIFTTDKSLPLNSDFELKKAQGFQLGPFWLSWPSFNSTLAQITLKEPLVPKQSEKIASLVGQELPQFALKSNTETLDSLSLRSKPTILTFLNSWLPQSAEQLSFINQLASNKEIKNVVIIPQESISSVEVFKKRGGYAMQIFADPDGITVPLFGIQSIPVHFFIDRKGIIKSIKVGVLTEQQMLDNLMN